MANKKDSDRELSWSDVRKGAQDTGGRSLVEAAMATIQPFLHPLETAETLKQLGIGAGSKAAGLIGVRQSAEQKAANEETINAIGRYYADRYGSMKGFKKALSTDAGGVLADIAGLATLGTGTLVRAPGMIGKAARVANKASKTLDPTNLAGWAAVRAPTAAYSKISQYKGPALGAGTADSISEARRAGLNKTPEFNLARTGKMSADDIVAIGDGALAKLKTARDNRYKGNKKYLAASKAQLNYNDIENKIADLRKANTSRHGLPIDPHADKTLNGIEAEVQTWKKTGHDNAGDFDDLKQRISRIQAANLRGADPTWNQAVATGVLGSIRDTIKKQVPEYANMMQDYAEASDLIHEMRTTLALGPKAKTSSGIKKLKNAFTGKSGADAFGKLSEVAPELPAAIAGYSMKEWLPQGLGAYTSPVGLIASGLAAAGHLPLGIPLTANTLLHSSPRALGKATYGLGAASRLATKWTPRGQRAVVASRELEEANRNRPVSVEEAEQRLLSPGLETRLSEFAPQLYEPQKPPSSEEGFTLEQLEQILNEEKSRNVEQLLKATKGVESGGRYDATGPETGHGRAAGVYQVMPENIPSWTKEALGREMTEDEFRNDPAAQEAVARFKMEQYYDKYGNVQDVSSVWHSGVPLAQAIKEKRRDANMTTQDYVNKVTAGIGDQPPPVENPEFPVGDSRRYPAAVTMGDRQGRATGGRITNHRSEAESLIRLADKTKKALNNSTESLLAVPDEAVTKALSIANEAI
jgi:hypothetical protein